MLKSEILKRFESQIETETLSRYSRCKCMYFQCFINLHFFYFRDPSRRFRPALILFLNLSGPEFLQPVVYIQTVFIFSKRTSQRKKVKFNFLAQPFSFYFLEKVCNIGTAYFFINLKAQLAAYRKGIILLFYLFGYFLQNRLGFLSKLLQPTYIYIITFIGGLCYYY